MDTILFPTAHPWLVMSGAILNGCKKEENGKCCNSASFVHGIDSSLKSPRRKRFKRALFTSVVLGWLYS